MSTILVGPSRAETVFWLALCGALAIGIGIETDWGRKIEQPSPEIMETSAAIGDFTPPRLAIPFRLPPPDTMLETSLRPLFIATRRPAPPPLPPEPPKPTMKRDQFTLTGITVLPDGKFAFLTEKAGNKNRFVQEGKEINGITVKEIQGDRVVLSQYDETEILMLRTAKGPAVTIQPILEKDASGAGAAGSQPNPAATAPPANAASEAGRAGTRPPPQSRAQLPAGQRPPTGSQ